MSDHLQPTVTDRGFQHLPPIVCDRDQISVYESSAANGPHIWLRIQDTQDTGDLCAHLSLEDATKLSEQLSWLVEHHYQVKEA